MYILERALSDIQLNWRNRWSWLRLLSFKIILAALVDKRSNALCLEGAKLLHHPLPAGE